MTYNYKSWLRRVDGTTTPLLADKCNEDRKAGIWAHFIDTANDATREKVAKLLDDARIGKGEIPPPEPPQEEPEPPPVKFLESVEDTPPTPEVAKEEESPPPTPQQAWIDEGCRWRPRGEPDPYYWEEDDDTEDYDPLGLE